MSQPPILTSAAGNGGIVAQDGFDYQLFYCVERIAEWLGDPTFEGVMVEALEDIEARFFAPQTVAGHQLIRIQAKSGDLDRAGVTGVLDNFVQFDQHYPDITKAFELVTPQLPAQMRWISRDLDRVRFAGPFYKPFREVLDASDGKVRSDLEDDLGTERGTLLFERGQIVPRAAGGDAGAIALFADAFEKTYPDLTAKRAVFEALVTRARASTKTFLTRAEIIATLEVVLKTPLELVTGAVLHVIGDRPGPISHGAIKIDAAILSGAGRFSEATVWEADFIEPLRKLKGWWQAAGRRRVAVEGSYRLSAAFAIGAIFNAGSGFDLDMDTKDGVWRTDDHASKATVAPQWTTSAASEAENGVLKVAVGVFRNPVESLVAAGGDRAVIASAFLDEAVTSGQQLQALVGSLKRFIGDEVVRLKATQVHLYFAGPAQLAMALGHRWNAIAPIQLSEFDSVTNTYFLTARL